MGHIPAGQVVLVTGATGAIGFEIAAQAAEGGAIVGVHGSREETVADAIGRIRERAPDAKLIPVPGNFAKLDLIEAVVEKVASEGGRLDAVIHCSTGNVGGGGRTAGVFAETDPADYVYRACPVDHVHPALAEVRIGSLALLPVPSPGHSHDHHCWLATGPDGERSLLAGDALFHGGKVALQHIYDCSVPDAIASIERIAEHPFDALLPGHGPFSLHGARRHVDAALAVIARLGCPQSII